MSHFLLRKKSFFFVWTPRHDLGTCYNYSSIEINSIHDTLKLDRRISFCCCLVLMETSLFFYFFIWWIKRLSSLWREVKDKFKRSWKSRKTLNTIWKDDEKRREDRLLKKRRRKANFELLFKTLQIEFFRVFFEKLKFHASMSCILLLYFFFIIFFRSIYVKFL